MQGTLDRPTMPNAIEDHAAHVAGRIADAPRSVEPFPHLLLHGLLPPDLFEQVRSLDVPAASLHQHAPGQGPAARESNRYSVTVTPETLAQVESDTPVLATVFASLWHPLVVQALTARFRPTLETEFGTVELAFKPGLVMVEDRTGYELLPHTDLAYKALTVLVYLAPDDADPALGTELYAFRGQPTHIPDNIMQGRIPRRWFNRVSTVPYRPNQGLAFAPAKNTFHGVGEVRGDSAIRRVLQFQLNVDRNVNPRRG